jgi:hypothetical protein
MPPKPDPKPPTDGTETKAKKRSPEYVALGLYKRANALDEAIETLRMKLIEKTEEAAALSREVAAQESSVKIVFHRLRGGNEKAAE